MQCPSFHDLFRMNPMSLRVAFCRDPGLGVIRDTFEVRCVETKRVCLNGVSECFSWPGLLQDAKGSGKTRRGQGLKVCTEEKGSTFF